MSSRAMFFQTSQGSGQVNISITLYREQAIRLLPELEILSDKNEYDFSVTDHFLRVYFCDF